MISHLALRSSLVQSLTRDFPTLAPQVFAIDHFNNLSHTLRNPAHRPNIASRAFATSNQTTQTSTAVEKLREIFEVYRRKK